MSKAREIAELGQKLTVDASGNIDVDGSVTSNTLSVDSNITVGGTVDGRDIAADGAVIDGLGTAATAASTDFVAVTGDTMTGPLDVQSTITSDGLTVDGDVGIGTSNPTEELHVYSGNAPVVLIEGAADNDARLRLLTPNDRIGYIEFADSEDIDTGEIRYEHSSNNMVFSTNGTSEAMRIDSSGNVGIGTTSPSQALDVRASSANNYQLRLGVNTSDTPTYDIGRNFSDGLLYFYGNQSSYTGYVFSGINGERMRIDSSGNVGIGTSSPDDVLHLYKSSNPKIILETQFSGSARGSSITSNANTMELNAGDTSVSAGGTSNLVFKIDSAEAMRIDASGNVGIGTDSPSSALHLKVASPVLTIQDADGVGAAATPFIIGSDSAGLTQWRVGNLSSGTSDLYIDSGNASGTRFISGVSERMRIDASGNVGIGTSSPARPLDVNGSMRIASGGVIEWGGTVTNFITGNNSSNYLALGTNSTERMRIDSSGNVGIGTSSPDKRFEVEQQADGSGIRLSYPVRTGLWDMELTGVASDGLAFKQDNGSTSVVSYIMRRSGHEWYSDGSEAMRIDSSGNLLVGKTANDNTDGVVLKADGEGYFVKNNGSPLAANRLSTDGVLQYFFKDTSLVGSIGTINNFLTIGKTDTGLLFQDGANSVHPWNIATNSASDGLVGLGTSNNRFDDIYATNGTIQTSDRNEKQDIDVLSDAEQRVAVACKGLLRKFRWKDAIAEKGDDARIHFGIIAQDLQDAFAAEGLGAGRYAMFISSTWWETQTEVPAVEAVAEVLDEDGNVVTEAVEAKEAYTRTDNYETAEEAPEGATERTRLGVRYPELLAFIIAAI